MCAIPRTFPAPPPFADWHITDDPAWSAESQTYPNFTDPHLGGPLNSQAYYSIADQASGVGPRPC